MVEKNEQKTKHQKKSIETTRPSSPSGPLGFHPVFPPGLRFSKIQGAGHTNATSTARRLNRAPQTKKK